VSFESVANGTVRYNNITTNGSSNNYGIYMIGGNETNITNNIILANGSSSDNKGIRLDGVDIGNIISNNISTISGSGDGTGILLDSGSNNILIHLNEINTTGSASSEGITVQNSNSTNVTSNYIRTTSTGGTGNRGIHLSASASCFVAYNDITTGGGTGSNGIQASGGAYNNTIAYNNITTVHTSSHGVAIFNSAGESTVRNNNVTVLGTSTSYGIYLQNAVSFNNVSYNNIVSSGGGSTVYGIFFDQPDSFGDIVSYNNITTTGSSGYGIALRLAHHVNLSYNRIATSGISASGIYLSGISMNNTFLYDRVSTSNQAANDYHTDTVGGEQPSLNVIRNLTLLDNGQNVTLESLGEVQLKAIGIAEGASLGNATGYTRLNVYINVTNSSAAQLLLNVSYNNEEFNFGNASILGARILRYDGTEFVNVTFNAPYGINNDTREIFANISLFNSTFGLFMDIAPILTLVTPGNYTNHSIQDVDVNYTVFDDVGLAACWYTNSSGTVNYTFTCGENLTGELWDEGLNTVTIYANDSLGNRDSAQITFTVDLTAPNVTALAPPVDAIFNGSKVIQVSASVIDSLTEVTIVLANVTHPDGTVDTFTLNLTSGIKYNESYTIPNTDGLYNVTIFANDSVNNINSTSVTNFTVDATFPNITFVDPTLANGSVTGTDSIFVNLSSSDGVGRDHYSFVDFDRDLVFWMRMDDRNNSDGNITDLSSWSNNGTAKGNAVFNDSGRFGGAFEFDGTGDDINMGDVLDLGTLDFTVMVWLKTSDNSRQRIIAKKPDSTAAGWHLETSGVGAGNLRIAISDGTNVAKDSDSNDYTDGEWHHVAVVFDRDDVATMYKDGVADGTLDITAASGSVDNGEDFHIGQSGNTAFFNGAIDDVLIFNRSLSADEIASLYNASTAQYFNNFTSLSEGVHRFTGYTVDTAGHRNSTDERSIETDSVVPNISFVDPTLANGSVVGRNYTEINVSIGEDNVREVIFNWDGTNYTIYNDSLGFVRNSTLLDYPH